MVWIVTNYGFFDLGFGILDFGFERDGLIRFRIWDLGFWIEKNGSTTFYGKIFLAKAPSPQR